MKLFAFSLREYDEKQYMDAICEKLGIEYRYTPDYPSDENLHLCQGCDCVSIITSITDKPMLDKLYALGVRYITTRSIGYEHIDVEYAHQLGMKVGNVGYAPESVANYAIMLMLMCCRNITHILKRADLQDYSLREKIGRDLSECTVGVIGTGRIGRTVMKHLSGFGCPMLAYDLVENEEAAALGQYVDLDTLLRESDIMLLETTDNKDHIEAAYHYLQRGDLPDALVVSFHGAAVLIRSIFNFSGVRVPEDVMIVSYAHTKEQDQIPCVLQRAFLLGSKSARKILEKLATPDDVPDTVLIPSELINTKAEQEVSS